jgi:mono/diheme cytochrome c family protein
MASTSGGMTRRGAFKSLLAGAAALAGAVLAPMNGAAASAPALPGDPAKGRELFLRFGASCHGVNLEGVVAPRLNPIQKLGNTKDPLDPNYLINVISNGLPGGMPAWKGRLSEQDIKDIAAFIIQQNRTQTGPTTLSAVDLARSNVLWVTIAAASISGLAWLLARYNMRWIARRARGQTRT